MLNNIKEIQNFILWCKKNGVKTAEIGQFKFELSEIALLPEEIQSNLKQKLDDGKSFIDDEDDQMTPDEYNELLFHSSRE